VVHCKNSTGTTYCCGSYAYNYAAHICCNCRTLTLGPGLGPYWTPLAEASAADKDEHDEDKSSETIPDQESDFTEAPANDEDEPDKDKPTEPLPDKDPDVTEAPVDGKDEPDKDKPINPGKKLHDTAPKAG